MMTTLQSRFSNVLKQFIVVLLVFLPVLPVVDLVDQPQSGTGNSHKRPGAVTLTGSRGEMKANGESDYLNSTTRVIAEMRDETNNMIAGGTSRITSTNWKGIAQRGPQMQQQSVMNDALSPSLVAAVVLPGSSSLTSSSPEFTSYEEERHKMHQKIEIPKSKTANEQVHLQNLNQHPQQHYHLPQAAAAALVDTMRGGNRAVSSMHHSSSWLWGESNMKQLVFPDEPPPLPLASSTRVTGPYFDSNETARDISANAGQNVVLDCTIILLQGRTVSWLRRGKDSLQLLTVGNITYYNDPRLGLRFRYPNNWRLGIDSVNKDDEGEYQCQVATHPVKTLIYHLKVIAPEVVIQDENGHSVTERHYKVDSSLHLTCKASQVDKFVDKVVWMKGDRPLSRTDNRVKIKVFKNEEVDETNVNLSILSLHTADSGNYSCRAGTLSKYIVMVHVVNGELPAAVQHESGSTILRFSPATVCFTFMSRILMTSISSSIYQPNPVIYI